MDGRPVPIFPNEHFARLGNASTPLPIDVRLDIANAAGFPITGLKRAPLITLNAMILPHLSA
jgi:hypothetical protein